MENETVTRGSSLAVAGAAVLKGGHRMTMNNDGPHRVEDNRHLNGRGGCVHILHWNGIMERVV